MRALDKDRSGTRQPPRHWSLWLLLLLACAAVVGANGDALAQKGGDPPPAKPTDKPADKPADKPDAKATDDAPAAKAKPAATKSGIDEARKRMEKGQALFKEGKYAEATSEFEAAYAAMPYSAFLYNAAFAAEKAGDLKRAIARYREYVASDPSSPDAERIKKKVAELEDKLTKLPPPTAAEGGKGAGGGDGAKPDAGAASPVPADEASMQEIRSLVLVESEPRGAPLVIYERVVPTAKPFKEGAENAGWRKIVSGVTTPKDLTLRVGHYHVVIEAFEDFKRSETTINLSPGHVYTFKANLSQGEFLGYLRVKSNVEGAKVFLDDPPPHKSAPWVRTPQGATLNHGEHQIWVEAPGFKPFHKKVTTPHGQTVEIEANLERVGYGYLVIEGNVEQIDVEIDDQPSKTYRKKDGALKIKLPAGKHKVVLDADDHKEFEGELDVPRGQLLPVKANLEQSYPRGKAIALGILGTGAVVGGVFMHLKYEDLQAQKAAGESVDEGAETIFNATRFVGWGLGGGLIALSVFYSIYDPYPDSTVKTDQAGEFPEDERQAPTKKKAAIVRPYAAPIAGPGVGGLVVGGRF